MLSLAPTPKSKTEMSSHNDETSVIFITNVRREQGKGPLALRMYDINKIFLNSKAN